MPLVMPSTNVLRCSASPPIVDESLQRFGPQGANEPCRSAAEACLVGAGVVFQFVGDLKEIADDDLIVGGAARVVIDRLRDRRRIGRSRVGLSHPVPRHRGIGQADPQLRPTPHLLSVAIGAASTDRSSTSSRRPA